MHNDFNHSTSGQTFGVHDNVAHCSISRKTMLANQRGERRIAPSLMHEQMYKNRAPWTTILHL
jgi:hypothetical protein